MFKVNENLAKLLLIILISITGGFIGGYFAFQNAGQLGEDNLHRTSEENSLISSVAKEVGRGVVSINVESNQVSNTFFGPQNFVTRSAGTGFIISKDGYIVTNRHVIPDGEPKISITLSSGDKLEDVSVVGKTAENDPLDIAFLKINDTKGNTLNPVDIGDSAKVEVGNSVVAIGNALGQFQNTVTSGIISGFGRDLTAGGSDALNTENLVNLFQTDAAINQGNSGGPLANMRGEVIGVNTAIAGDGAQNIGFAIPINDIKGLIKSVLRDGKVQRPFLGIRYINLDEDIAKEKGLTVKEGAYLVNTESGPAVIKDSPADKAGLKEGDVVTEVNGQAINNTNSVLSLIGQYSVGDQIELKIKRGDQEMSLAATLTEFKD